MKDWLRAAAACVAALLLTACSGFPLGANTEDLLRAPQTGAEQKAVQKALAGYLGQAPQLKYPRGGDISTPLLFVDLDGDGEREAVVTYLAESLGRNVHLAVLEKEEGEWQVACDQDGLSNEVASLETAQLLSAGTQLLVGYANTNLADKYLAVYDYRAATLTRLCEQAYTQYRVDDLTGSGQRQLVLVQPTAQEGALTLQLYGAGEDVSLTNVQTLGLDERFVSCRGLYPTRSGTRTGLVVDGTFNSGSIACEVLAFENERLVLWPQEDTDVLQRTLRFVSGLVPTDFSGMGAVEVPVGTSVNITLSSARRFYLVSWYDYLAEEPPQAQSEAVSSEAQSAEPEASEQAEQAEQDYRQQRFGVYDAAYGYFVRLPDAWQGEVALADGSLADEWQVRRKSDNALLVSVRVPQRNAALSRYSRAAALGERSVYVYASDACSAEEARVIRTGVTVLK